MAIVLRIPIGPLAWVRGDCTIAGYENMILCNSMSYDLDIEDEINSDGRRTVHSPKMSVVTLERQVDPASVDIARMMLSTRVSPLAWEIYMLREADGGKIPVQPLGPGIAGLMSQQVCYMMLRLHHALVTKQDVSADEGGLTETIEVSCGAVEWRYMVIDQTQLPAGLLAFRYNLQTGTLE